MTTYIEPIPPDRKYCKQNRKHKPLPENCWIDQPDSLPDGATRIELSRGLFAIVDSDIADYLNRFNWSVMPDGGTCYAVTRDANGGMFKMHRVILKINNGSDVTIDHIDHNGLNNMRSNLRIVSRSQNQHNRRDRTKRKNRFIGVYPGLTHGFQAWVPVKGKKTKKNFDSEVEAARYYDYMIVKERGPEAKTNLSKGRFTQEELDSFGGVISNPIAELNTVADIKFQRGMICMTEEEFQSVVHRISASENKLSATEKDLASAIHRVILLEDQLRVTESELKRALSQ